MYLMHAHVQVLKSHLLPASVADEQLIDILRALPENPGMYEKIVDSLFAIPNTAENLPTAPECYKQVDYAAHLGSNVVSSESMASAGVPVHINPAVILSLVSAVEKTCMIHGFVPMQSRLVRSFPVFTCKC